MPATLLTDSQILSAISATGESDPGPDAKLRLIAQQRALSSDPVRLDRVFIAALTEWRSRFEEVRESQEALRAMIEELTAPPLREGMFCGRAVVAGETLGIVVSEQARRFVRAGPDIALEAFQPGDRVVLTQSGSAIVARGTDAGLRGAVGTIERLAGRHLVVRQHGEETLVGRAGALADVELRAGDQVLWDVASGIALAVMPPVEDARWLLEELPDIERGQLAGLGAAPDRIIARFVMRVLHPELAREYGIDDARSLLLHGPPGCGKTTMMRVIAAELGRASGTRCKVAVVNGADLESPWVGETQANVRALFRRLDAAGDAPCLLFIDEVEAIGRTRGSFAGHHSDKFLSTWLAQLDGVRGRRNLAVVVATNRKDLVDPALLERLSSMELFVPRPDMAAAREIFRVHLRNEFPVHDDGAGEAAARTALIDVAVLGLYAPNAPGTEVARLRFRDNRERVVAARDLMSGRLIQQICRNARDAAFDRNAAGGTRGVRVEDMEAAVGDALDRLATVLTVRNARDHLADLPDDVDVVSVERIRRRGRRDRLIVPALAAARA